MIEASRYLECTTMASVCPGCAIGRQARSEVWNADFGFNLIVALIPFLIIGRICLWAETITTKGARS